MEFAVASIHACSDWLCPSLISGAMVEEPSVGFHPLARRVAEGSSPRPRSASAGQATFRSQSTTSRKPISGSRQVPTAQHQPYPPPSRDSHRGQRTAATKLVPDASVLSSSPTVKGKSASSASCVGEVTSAPKLYYKHGRITYIEQSPPYGTGKRISAKLKQTYETEQSELNDTLSSVHDLNRSEAAFKSGQVRKSSGSESEEDSEDTTNAEEEIDRESGAGSRSLQRRPVTVVLASEPLPAFGRSLPNITADELANNLIKAAITPTVTVTPLPHGSDSFSAIMSELSSESSSAFPSTASLNMPEEGGGAASELDDKVADDIHLPRSVSSNNDDMIGIGGASGGGRQRAYSLPASILKRSEAAGRRTSQHTRPNHVHFSQKLTKTALYTKRTITRLD